MKFEQFYLSTAITLIKNYNGKSPLASYLKQFFILYKKHGSRDRKSISALCFNFYRIGHILKELSIEERILVAIFLCQDDIKNWSTLLAKEWVDTHSNDLTHRINFIQTVYPSFNLSHLFPWIDALSAEIETTPFLQSHLSQPFLFLRVRPSNVLSAITSTLEKNQIGYQIINDTTLKLPNTTKVDALFKIDKEVVIQDRSSQEIGQLFQHIQNIPTPFQVWDCCAASGGKSILVYDYLPNIKLTVSDVRPNMLKILAERFQKAGITNYISFTQDLAKPIDATNISKFQLIICDAPCTGSGTWSRTPEQLCFFQESQLLHYAQLQRKIVTNTVKSLDNNGYFLYITCSVFAAENEEQVAYIQQKLQLKLIASTLFKGYNHKADTLFAALFLKNV